MTQPSLFDTAPPPPVTAPASDTVLTRLLTRYDTWLTARQLTELLELPNSESGRRQVRDLADQSKGQVAGGNQGYRLITQMTDEEYSHALLRMRSMASEIINRLHEMEQVRSGKPAEPSVAYDLRLERQPDGKLVWKD